MLDRFQPGAVLLMVGVADFWNLDSFQAEDYSGWRWFLWGGGWWDRSRVVKLARLIRFNLEHGREEVPAEQPSVEHTPYNWKIGGGGEAIDVDIDMHFDDGIKDILVFRRQLRRNLSLIAAQAQARGVPLILMTYPTEGGFYAAVNDVYRQFAASAHLPLIDLAAQTATWSRPPLLAKAYFPDFHPRRAGYELSARIIERELGLCSPEVGPSRGEFIDSKTAHRYRRWACRRPAIHESPAGRGKSRGVSRADNALFRGITGRFLWLRRKPKLPRSPAPIYR
jgi:hypothetical protein